MRLATTALRSTVRARRDLVAHRVTIANQLRAHLQIVFPAAASLFADIDSDISLRFLERFTTQTRADWLTVKRLAAWLSSVGYCGRTDPAVLHQERVTVFGRTAENALNSLTKGNTVLVTGDLTVRGYTRTDGTPGTANDIIADHLGAALTHTAVTIPEKTGRPAN